MIERRRRRLCPGCGERKPLTSEFWHRRGDGWQVRCKPCMVTAVRKNHGKHVDKLRELKEASPCMDCGRSYSFYVMQYDHRPGVDKVSDVGKMAKGSYTWERILAEIAKCDLVCANCHAERTWQRANGLSGPERAAYYKK